MHFIVLHFLALINMSRVSTEIMPPEKNLNLPTPRIYGMSIGSEDGPTILWHLEDESGDETILGYKVKLWQVGCDKKPKYAYVEGERVRLKNVMPKLRDLSTLRNLTEFTVDGADSNRLFLKGIEPDVPYHVTVAAYSQEGVGPSSNNFRFQHRGRYTCREI